MDISKDMIVDMIIILDITFIMNIAIAIIKVMMMVVLIEKEMIMTTDFFLFIIK